MAGTRVRDVVVVEERLLRCREEEPVPIVETTEELRREVTDSESAVARPDDLRPIERGDGDLSRQLVDHPVCRERRLEGHI